MKRLAFAALPLAMVTACGGSSSSSPSTGASSSSSSAIHYDGTYDSLDALRSAVREAGIQCPESTWKPAATPTSEYMTGDGWCGDTVRIATTKDDAVSQGGAMVDFTMETANRSVAAPNGFSAKYAQGKNWIVQVPTEDAQGTILRKMGGGNPITESGGGSATANGPDDTGVTASETHFVQAEREALPGLSTTSGAVLKKIGNYACDQIETVPASQLQASVAAFAEELDGSVSWSAAEARTFITTANQQWCSDKTPAA